MANLKLKIYTTRELAERDNPHTDPRILHKCVTHDGTYWAFTKQPTTFTTTVARVVFNWQTGVADRVSQDDGILITELPEEPTKHKGKGPKKKKG